jgi:hypothetical protein
VQAIEKGQLEKVEELLKKGADIHARNRAGQSALELAVKRATLRQVFQRSLQSSIDHAVQTGSKIKRIAITSAPQPFLQMSFQGAIRTGTTLQPPPENFVFALVDWDLPNPYPGLEVQEKLEWIDSKGVSAKSGSWQGFLDGTGGWFGAGGQLTSPSQGPLGMRYIFIVPHGSLRGSVLTINGHPFASVDDFLKPE